MPNYCENEVKITLAKSGNLDEFLAKLGDLDDPENNLFDNFIPTPQDKLEEGGWHEWRMNNWGTKWNPEILYHTIDRENKVITLDLNTAWSPPLSFFNNLFSVFDGIGEIEVAYLEEGMGFCGRAWMCWNTLEDKYINEIPVSMYVAAGMQLDENGKLDWEGDYQYDLWKIISNENEFQKFYEESKQ